MSIRTYAIAMGMIAVIGCEGVQCSPGLTFSGGPRGELREGDASSRVEWNCPAVSIAVGQRHTCIVTCDENLVCFGDNREGQVLLGERTSEPVSPRRMDQRAHQVALGAVHTCVTYDGAVLCWGRPELVGTGGQPSVWPNHQATEVIVGALHSCWLRESSVECMGVWDGMIPELQSLGDGGFVASAGTQGCAIASNSLWCWGGIAPTGLFAPGDWARSPHRISGDWETEDHYFTNISLSPLHGCVVRSERFGASSFGVWCWGQNQNGQLGIGNDEASSAPVRVVWDWRESSGTVIGLATGAEMSIEWTDAGPVLAYGAAHTCAVVGDVVIDGTGRGAVDCWGNNDKGQLGDGTQVSSPVPVRVVGLPDKISRIEAGGAHTCALDITGGVWCWGDNAFGQLGVPSETAAFRARPERVAY